MRSSQRPGLRRSHSGPDTAWRELHLFSGRGLPCLVFRLHHDQRETRLSEGWLNIYNPDKVGAGMDSDQGRRVHVRHQRPAEQGHRPAVQPVHGVRYNALNHLTSVKSVGQLPIQLNYVTLDQREKLDTVKRDPAGGPDRWHGDAGEVRVRRTAVRRGSAGPVGQLGGLQSSTSVGQARFNAVSVSRCWISRRGRDCPGFS